MKLELVKETKINGTILYSVEMDGKYVSNTATENLKQEMLKVANRTDITDEQKTQLLALCKEKIIY